MTRLLRMTGQVISSCAVRRGHCVIGHDNTPIMKKLTRLLKWILKAAVFFALFAFALNNQQDATVHLLFGREWRAPMTLIVLVAFALGMVVGVLGMLPGWWSRRHGKPPAAPFPGHAPLDDALTAPPHGI
jgi:uncharacterized integral membrane protein